MSATAYCSRACYHAVGAAEAGRRGGKPRTKETILVETSVGLKTAANIDGYVYVYWPDHPAANKNGRVAQHRLVMEDALGRTLYPDEKVHHRNGQRSDNQLENLELWSVSHPAGQRVEDKLAWAHEFIARYETT